MQPQIVVTGWGCITATGHQVQTVWEAIQHQKNGIDVIQQWDSSQWEYPLGAEIKNFDAKQLLTDRKLLKSISRHDIFGLYAADTAIADSGLKLTPDFADDTGIFVGSPGNKYQQQYDFLPLIAKDNLSVFAQELFSHVHPMWLLRNLPNNVLAYTGIQHQLKGPNQNMTNHVVGGVQAILEAYYQLKIGNIKRAVVIGYDFGIDPQSYLYYGNLGLLSKTALKPFDKARDGTIFAEGAGALVLELAEDAQRRQTPIYGEILGGTTTCESAGLIPIEENGDGLYRAMEQTLQQAELSPARVGLITAHANGTLQSDRSEAQAIGRCFKGFNPKVTGFKWSLGHTLTAAGVIETILTLLSLKAGIAPGIANLTYLDPECAMILAEVDHQRVTEPVGLINVRGFGSLNSCLAVRLFHD